MADRLTQKLDEVVAALERHECVIGRISDTSIMDALAALTLCRAEAGLLRDERDRQAHELKGCRAAYDLMNKGMESQCELHDTLKQESRGLAAEAGLLRDELERARESMALVAEYLYIAFEAGLPVPLARALRVCRVCRQPDAGPLALDYGREYAHTKCLESKGA